MMLISQKKRLIIVLINFFILFTLSVSAESVKMYEINATIKPKNFKLEGNELIDFIPEYNTNKLFLHLYWNGLQKGTSLYKGAPNSLKNRMKEKPLSNISISKLFINNKKILKYSLGKDKTLLKVNYSFKKNKQYNIKIFFNAKIPKKRYIRFGYSQEDKVYWISQWYPKIAVLTGKDRWHAKPFYYHYEFFNEYSKYKLRLKTPPDYKIVSNLKRNNTFKKNGFKVYTASGEKISDCVFGIGKNLYTTKKTFKNEDLTIYLTNYKKLTKEQKKEIINRAYFDIKKLSSWVGPYQYKEFKIVNLATIGENGAGMEYPKLVHLGSSHGNIRRVLDHEIAHQWFYGMIGFNQVSEGWLDEGYTSYYEIRLSSISSKNKKESSNSRFFGLTNFDFHYIPVNIAWIHNVNQKNPSKKGNIFQVQYKNSDSGYKIMFLYYMKHPVILKFLESEIGKDNIDQIFKKIYEEYQFKHPNTQQIMNIFRKSLSKKNFAIFEKNLKSYAKTDVSLKKRGAFFTVNKEKDYTKNVSTFLKNKNAGTTSTAKLFNKSKIKAKKYDIAYIKNLDYNIGNNFFITSLKYNIYNFLYGLLLLIILFFLIKIIKNKKVNFLSKNALLNNLIFAPLFIYSVIITFPQEPFNSLEFDFSYLSAVGSRIASNPPIIIGLITIFLLLIKISTYSTFFYRKQDASYSIFTILILDLISFLLIGLYISSLFISKSFSIFYFMLFVLTVSLIEPIKIYFLRKDPKILFSLKSTFLTHFVAGLIYTVLLIMTLFMIAPFFLKFPFSILIFITVFSILEQIYRWGNLKLIHLHTRKEKNES